jgi:esterase/lipase
MEAEAFMESNPDILKKGYFLPGSNGFLVICVHGFGGSPAEHYFTAKALNEAGYSVSVPLLKGHGTRIEDLDVCHYQDWISQQNIFVASDWSFIFYIPSMKSFSY